ncbi:hypothetical protein AcdelDRAFT_2762, partial [Acidovorax delafieldii 2AN]
MMVRQTFLSSIRRAALPWAAGRAGDPAMTVVPS